MASSAKWVQAILLTISLILLVGLLYIFIARVGINFPHEARRSHPLSSRRPPYDPMASNSSTNAFRPKRHITVKTRTGQVRGFTQDVFGHNVHTFLGIPYSQPPIGSLRFRRPTPLVPFKYTLDADAFKPKCVQLIKQVPIFTDVSPGMSENCLFLNVWTPSVNATGDDLKPVMIWVYGGGFFMGTSSFEQTDGRVLSAYGDVVVVTFDYRLGPLGFMDLGTDREAGNQGLYDQAMAFKWIKDNARSFGGDPGSITLFGESSGAIAIGLHTMSPESNTLFHRVILQSGSPFMTNAFYTRGERSVPDWVKDIGCIERDGEYDIPCLRRKTMEDIIKSSTQMHHKYFFPFTPTAEEDFVPFLPTEFTKQPDQDDIVSNLKDVMIGNNRDAFSFMLYLANKMLFPNSNEVMNLTDLDSIKSVMKTSLHHLLQMPNFQVDFITNRLFKNITDVHPHAFLNRLIHVLGDVSFICPSNILADTYADLGKSVYMYEFSHRSVSSPWSDWMGVTLHDEIPLIFGHPLRFPLQYDGKDIDLSKRMMRTWTTFARTGSPPDQQGVQWPKYEADNKKYIILNEGSSPQVKSNLSYSSCETFKLGFELLN